MARQKLRAGQLGTVRTITLPSGRIQARARLCDEVGKLHQLKASGTTEALAETALREKADAILNDTGGPTLTKDVTITEVAAVFLYDKGRSGTVEDSTMESYEASVRNVITPTCGDLLLRDFTVRRCNRILADIREQRSLAAARKARSVLSMICQTGIEYDILAFNPVRDARRLPLPEKKTAVLTPEQLLLVQRLIRTWRKDSRYGPRPNVETLENAMWIMVGTSVRVGEVLALRRCDVDVASSPPSALVNATIKQTKKQGIYRKPSPKRTRQKRRIALPSFAAAAVRSQLARTGKGAEAYLFATKSGKPLSVSNYERLLRTFVDDNKPALQSTGIETERFSTHIFRRSTATLVEAVAGITLASRLLGHANEQITRASYVVSAELVDPVTAEIIDEAFAELF
ncbi:tyrosine-type recombinase/integrase [Agromyces sp. NBRC 114283]|uniref:tyrosine-type recombinase/integrase n=1 Tax=Agromyces sp. NBRC 114283 TaxID=2994521 RepID=UPI0024A3E66B|nr:tyrosine-type recombinase/integrase [Agromyces sp. NBRC 114283]GLU89684.1 phage integrase [Agromyces sp. NBRC 114283]